MNKQIGQANGIHGLVQATTLPPQLNELLTKVGTIIGQFDAKRVQLAALVGDDAARLFFGYEGQLSQMAAGKFVTKPQLEIIIAGLDHISAVIADVFVQQPDFFGRRVEFTTINAQIQGLPALKQQLLSILATMAQLARQPQAVFWVATDPFSAARTRRTALTGLAALAGGALQSREGFDNVHDPVNPTAPRYSKQFVLAGLAVTVELETDDQSYLAGNPGQIAAGICEMLTNDFDAKVQAGELTLDVSAERVEVTVNQQGKMIAKCTFETMPKSEVRFGKFDSATRQRLVDGLKPIAEQYSVTIRTGPAAALQA